MSMENKELLTAKQAAEIAQKVDRANITKELDFFLTEIKTNATAGKFQCGLYKAEKFSEGVWNKLKELGYSIIRDPDTNLITISWRTQRTDKYFTIRIPTKRGFG